VLDGFIGLWDENGNLIGASHATFIDQSAPAIQCLRRNLQALNLLNTSTLLKGSALPLLKSLAKNGASFDLIYIDPPYNQSSLQEEALQIIDSSSLLTGDGLLFLETAAITPLSLPLSTLSLTKKRKCGSSNLLQFTNSQ